MQKTFAPFAAAALVMLCAFPAHAEKWLWYPVKGGAVAFDDDSRKSDVSVGTIAANTVIFYDTPKTAGPMKYSFVAERLEFECRSDRHRWSQSAILDQDGDVVTKRDDSIWTPLGPEMGSTALFKRMLCMAQNPPGEKQAKDLEALIVAVRAAAPKAEPATAVGPTPKAAAVAPKADAVKLTPAGPVLKPAPAPKTPAPIDLDALASGPAASKEPAKAPAAKTTAPAAKAPQTKAPPTKAPTSSAPAPKLRPLTE